MPASLEVCSKRPSQSCGGHGLPGELHLMILENREALGCAAAVMLGDL